MSFRLFTIVIAFLFVGSCKPASEAGQPSTDGIFYFPLKGFIKDQWDTYHGQPFSLVKTVILNGKTDSSYISGMEMEWGALIKMFFDADINHPKFAGQYEYSNFDDMSTGTRNLYYEAKDVTLYTRKMHIAIDLETSRIRSVFIETEDNTRGHSKNRKLFYKPVKLITIQEFEKSTPGPDKDLRIEYRFM